MLWKDIFLVAVYIQKCMRSLWFLVFITFLWHNPSFVLINISIICASAFYLNIINNLLKGCVLDQVIDIMQIDIHNIQHTYQLNMENNVIVRKITTCIVIILHRYHNAIEIRHNHHNTSSNIIIQYHITCACHHTS